jgi:hypothetical protein
MSSEELYIKNIEQAFNDIKKGFKLPNETNIGKSLNRLKEINIGLYEDYLSDYKKILKNLTK